MRHIGVRPEPDITAILIWGENDDPRLRNIDFYWDGYGLSGSRGMTYVLNPIENCLVVGSDGTTMCCPEDRLDSAIAEYRRVLRGM